MSANLSFALQAPHFSLRGPGLTLTSRTMSLELTHLELTLMQKIEGIAVMVN